MIEFFCPGKPATKGSTRQVWSRSQNRLFTAGANPRTKAWQGVVACAAQEAGVTRTEGPVVVSCEFRFARPASHFGTGKNARALRGSAPRYPMTRNIGDTDKLVRACLDALEGLLYTNDAQVVDARGTKRWCEPGESEGALIRVEVLT